MARHRDDDDLKRRHTDPDPTAWQYVRWSDEEQDEGDSLRRQTDLGRRWSARKGVPLPQSNVFVDAGKSGFRGRHREGRLGELIEYVERGVVRPGDFVIVENIDRLSREAPIAALSLITGLLQKGIRLVTLSPIEAEYSSQSEAGHLFMMLSEVVRAHGESSRKSSLSGPAWRQKKELAREGHILSHRLPGWVRIANERVVAKKLYGDLVENEHADTVRRIFRLAIDGHGIPSIIRRLTADGTPTMGRRPTWGRPYVHLILSDRRVLGEYQPRQGKAKQGEVIRDYYPQIITQEEWDAARGSVAQRKTYPGRTSPKADINIFAGLLKHARDNDPYQMTRRISKTRTTGRRVSRSALLNSKADQGQGRAYSVPYLPFESAILRCLREIDPAEVTGEDGAGDELLGLSGVVAGLEQEIAVLNEAIRKKAVADLVQLRSEKEEEREAAAAKMAEARARAASPLSEAWGECRTLAEVLAQAEDQREVRVRLRRVLRRLVERIDLLIIPDGQDRLATVQIDFQGGGRRIYHIYHRQASGRRPEKTVARSHRDDGGGPLPQLDIRRPEVQAEIEKYMRHDFDEAMA